MIAALLVALASLVVANNSQNACAFEEFQLWPALAPGEPEDAPKPTYELWTPDEKTSDTCLVVAPGGAYDYLSYENASDLIAKYFNSKGVTAVILKYRTPRRKGLPKHMAAWQDAQRMVRVVRARAKEWEINPDKIGFIGFSAGGHLALMVATTSQTPAYEPIDEIDKLPCNVNFAVPIYPAYVLEDGVNGPNVNQGNDSPMVDDFAFDEKTPPMCLVHGDADAYSPMGSVAVYAKLRKMNVPAELHIFTKVGHGFVASPPNNHYGNWLDRAYYWMQKLGY